MATNVPMPNVDPIEIQIHETFDRLVYSLNERRMELVTRYREVQTRPADRARMEPIVLAMTTFGTIVTDVFLPRPLLFWRDSPALDLSNQRRIVRVATPTTLATL